MIRRVSEMIGGVAESIHPASKIGSTSDEKIIVFISCMHVGHRVALWPEGFETVEGVTILPSPAQRVLLEYWDEFWQGDAKKSDIVMLLGDTTEGQNRMENGQGLMTPSLMEQVRAAGMLLEPHVQGKRVISFLGSKYHSGENWETDTAVVDSLGGDDFGIIANLEIGDTGKIMNVAHVAGDAMIYRATTVDRDSLFFDAIEGPFKHSKLPFHVDLYVRGHWHWYHLQENESRMLLTVPCWKFWHPFRKKVSKWYARSQPTIGACVAYVSSDGIMVKKYTYEIVHVYDALRRV